MTCCDSDSLWRSSYTDHRCSTEHTASRDTNHAHTTSDMPPACQHTAAALYSPSLWCESCFHVASSKVGLHNNVVPACRQVKVNIKVCIVYEQIELICWLLNVTDCCTGAIVLMCSLYQNILQSGVRMSMVLNLDVRYALAIKSDVTLHAGRKHILAACSTMHYAGHTTPVR